MVFTDGRWPVSNGNLALVIIITTHTPSTQMRLCTKADKATKEIAQSANWKNIALFLAIADFIMRFSYTYLVQSVMYTWLR